jgi:hypothetical protein
MRLWILVYHTDLKIKKAAPSYQEQLFQSSDLKFNY